MQLGNTENKALQEWRDEIEKKGANGTFLNGALLAADLGLHVIPCWPGTKKPRYNGFAEKGTTDKETIKKWWSENPCYNVAYIPHKSSKLMIDYDCKGGKRGLEIRDEWRKSHTVPDTVTVRTPTGGIHEHYTGTDERYKTIAYSCDGLFSDKSVDVRGYLYLSGSGLLMAMFPPSVIIDAEHPERSGCYTWEKPPVLYPFADANDAVYSLLERGHKEQPPKGGKDNRGEGHEDAPTKDLSPLKDPPEWFFEPISDGDRHDEIMKRLGYYAANYPVTVKEIEQMARRLNNLCEPPMLESELQGTIFPGPRKWIKNRSQDVSIAARLRELDPANNKRFGWNDAGGARLFIDVCSERIQYAEDRKKWLFYDGIRWDADGENAVKEELKLLANALTIYGLQCVNDDKRVDFLKYATKWQQLHTRETILKDAASVSPVKSDRFDRQPFLLNVQNGTLDLNTFELKPHNEKDYLSRVANVEYNPEATAPRWLRFIDEITAEKETGKPRPDLARFIQKAAGYALTGDTRHECLFILYGATSRNGKSTLLETLAAMLGDYAKAANPETFTKTARANDNTPSEDIARLAGVRFVTVSEPPRGMELNASLVKSLTGRDSIKARRLYESSFEYVPQFKLFFNTNHRPRVDDMTVFASDRVKIIPFDVHFGEGQRDPNLKAELQKPESLSGILNWALEGLRLLCDEGFGMPEAVIQATQEYRRKQDKIGRFLEEKTVFGADYEVTIMDLHNALTSWCSETGVLPVSVARLKEELEERQIAVKRKRPNGAGRASTPLTYVCGVKIV